jgi:rubrerythrin
MSKTETINDLLDVAIAAEQAARQAYERMAQMFASYPDVKVFWERLAAEETGHANWLKGLRTRLSPAELAAPADTNIVEVMNSLQQLSVDGLLNKIENLDEAFQLAHEMEHAETNVVFSFLVDHFSEDESAHAFLKTQLKAHINHLVLDLPVQFRGTSARQAVKAVQ